jgi:hypothetical protein
MYLRCHIRSLDIDTKDLQVLNDYAGDISYDSFSSFLRDEGLEELNKNILTLLHQIENNPHINCLSFDHTFKSASYLKLLVHISAYCPSVNKLLFLRLASIDDIIAALNLFPAVTALTLGKQYRIEPILSPMQTYLNITALAVLGVVDENIAALCHGFPNLRELVVGRCDPGLLSTILINCPRIASIRLNDYVEPALDEADIMSLLAVVARQGLNMKEFNLGKGNAKAIHLHDPLLEADVIKAINRLDSFPVDLVIRNKHNDPIFTYPHVRAQVVDVDTLIYPCHDVITALITKSKKVQRLALRQLKDDNNRSCLIVLIPTYCFQLNDLNIFKVEIVAEEMKKILLSCPLLRRLNLTTILTADLLEKIALHGGNLTYLYLYHHEDTNAVSFPSNSSMWSNTTRRQTNRRHPMSILFWQSSLDILSTRVFLSYFGLVHYLIVNFSSNKLLPDEKNLSSSDSQQSYHYRAIRLDLVFKYTNLLTEVIFFEMVEACQGLTYLVVKFQDKKAFFNGDLLISWAEKCSQCPSYPLNKLFYSGKVHFMQNKSEIAGIKISRY